MTIAAITDNSLQVVQQGIQTRARSYVRKIATECGLWKSSTHKILKGRTCFHSSSRFVNLSMFALSMEETSSPTICFKRLRLMWDIFGFSTKPIFTSIALWINKKNWQFGGKENHHISIHSPIHSPKVTVWAAISSKGIIWPYFLYHTITAARYLEVLHDFVAMHNELKDSHDSSWFMRKGTKP